MTLITGNRSSSDRAPEYPALEKIFHQARKKMPVVKIARSRPAS